MYGTTLLADGRERAGLVSEKSWTSVAPSRSTRPLGLISPIADFPPSAYRRYRPGDLETSASRMKEKEISVSTASPPFFRGRRTLENDSLNIGSASRKVTQLSVRAITPSLLLLLLSSCVGGGREGPKSSRDVLPSLSLLLLLSRTHAGDLLRHEAQALCDRPGGLEEEEEQIAR